MPRSWISIVFSVLAGAACGGSEQPQGAGELAAAAGVQEAEPLKLLLEVSDQRLYVHLADDGRFYTVTTKADHVLAERLDEAALAASYPSLHEVLHAVQQFSEGRGAMSRKKAMDAALAPCVMRDLGDSEAMFSLETRSHVLHLHSTELGTLYTVESKDGRVLAEGITEVELGMHYPDLHAIVLDGVDLIATGRDETYR